MNIYTEESHLEKYNRIHDWMDNMVVFQHDLDIIANQDRKLYPIYLKNIEDSLRNLNNDSVPTVNYHRRNDRIRYLKEPFKLFNMLDPGGNHDRFSIYPYSKQIREHYDLQSPVSTKNSKNQHIGNMGKYIKHNYDRIDYVYACLEFYRSYISNLILEDKLNKIPLHNKGSSTKKAKI